MKLIQQKIEKEKLFKLVLGAGNKSIENIENVVSVYANAGVDILDVNPSMQTLGAVFAGIKTANKNVEEFSYCISYTISNDTHSTKAFVAQRACSLCRECIEKCIESAITFADEKIKIDFNKCIGCKKCACDAIYYKTQKSYEWNDFSTILKNYPIAIVELHISTPDKEEIFSRWKYIIDNFDGYLSICVDRTYFGNFELLDLLSKMIAMTDKDRIIIQADGAPMSGGQNTCEATLQAIACAHLLQPLNTKIFISGGTNAQTAKLAKMNEINFSGTTVGSYARKIIKNLPFEKAILEAKKLVEATKNV